MTGGAAAASLHVPLDELTAAGLGSTITFYAARAGAFVDLAADIRYTPTAWMARSSSTVTISPITPAPSTLPG